MTKSSKQHARKRPRKTTATPETASLRELAPLAGVEFEGLVPAGRRFNLSRVTMWRLYKSGAFEARRFGNKTLVRVADVRRYLDGLPTVPSKAA